MIYPHQRNVPVEFRPYSISGKAQACHNKIRNSVSRVPYFSPYPRAFKAPIPASYPTRPLRGTPLCRLIVKSAQRCETPDAASFWHVRSVPQSFHYIVLQEYWSFPSGFQYKLIVFPLPERWQRIEMSLDRSSYCAAENCQASGTPFGRASE